MTRLAVRGLAARRLRSTLTALAIVLGVALVCAALTVGATLRRGVDSLSSAAYRGTDAAVTTHAAFTSQDSDTGTTLRPVPGAALDRVRAVTGVRVAAGDVLDTATVIGSDGKPVGSGPYFGVGFDAATPGAQRLSPFRLRSGAWASGPGQVVLDAGIAAKQGLRVGSTVRIAASGPARPFRVVGVADFGAVKSLGTATAAIFDLRAAQAMFHRGGGYDSILVAGRGGTPPATLRARLSHALPGLQVRSAQAQDRYALDGLKGFISIIRYVLLGFGIVAVLVGAFTIVNALSITVAQRSRELALLRALGATRRQLLGSVLLEALAVGAGASVAGVLVGIGLAAGLIRLLAGFGLDLPHGATVLAPSTVVISLAVGTLVTLAAALVPARRATRVAPVAMLAEGADQTGKAGRCGRAVRVLVGLLGRPAERLGGSAGALARANAMRHPGRIAATASALTIGVMLVALVAVIGNGLKQSGTGDLAKQIRADYVVAGADGWSPIEPGVARSLAAAPGVRSVSAIRQDEVRVGAAKATVDAVDPRTIGAAMRFDWAHGSDRDLAALGGDGAIVREDFATKHGLSVGSPLAVTTRSGARLALRVRAIESVPALNPLNRGQVTIAADTFARHFHVTRDRIAFVSGGGSAAALNPRLTGFPAAKLQTTSAFATDQAKWVDQLMAIFYVLLALAVIVSLFGIVNTLVLSVFERTRELGMLHAIGMTRRQVRRMVRHESVITALLGASTGIVLGLVLAAGFTAWLADKGLRFSVPVGALVVLVVVAVLAGVAAAVLPARRAARLNPLAALAALAYE